MIWQKLCKKTSATHKNTRSKKTNNKKIYRQYHTAVGGLPRSGCEWLSEISFA